MNKRDLYEKDMGLIKNLYRGTNNDLNFKIVTERDIKKGERLHTVLLGTSDEPHTQGIDYDQRLDLQFFYMKRDIKKGQILYWNDVFSTYGNKKTF